MSERGKIDGLPKTMVESLLDLDEALVEKPDMRFDEFEARIEKDMNVAALEAVVARVENCAPAEDVRTLLSLMVVHLSRYTPGYEEIRPLLAKSMEHLQDRANKIS
jgi:hypothetical protein